MKICLENDVALVTGAGRGNGRTIALGLAEAGAAVFVTDIDEASAHSTAEAIEAAGGKAAHARLDIQDTAGCGALPKQVQRELGPISILVNNAGIMRRATVQSETALQDWRQTIDVNVNGTFQVTHAFLDHLIGTKGRIVNMASIQSFVAPPNSAAYTASKGAIAQLTKALAVELVDFGIRVNAIAPAIIETELSRETRESPDYPRYLEAIPMRRAGQPQELVGPVLFLVSEMSTFVTGVVIPIDGGRLAR